MLAWCCRQRPWQCCHQIGPNISPVNYDSLYHRCKDTRISDDLIKGLTLLYFRKKGKKNQGYAASMLDRKHYRSIKYFAAKSCMPWKLFMNNICFCKQHTKAFFSSSFVANEVTNVSNSSKLARGSGTSFSLVMISHCGSWVPEAKLAKMALRFLPCSLTSPLTSTSMWRIFFKSKPKMQAISERFQEIQAFNWVNGGVLTASFSM